MTEKPFSGTESRTNVSSEKGKQQFTLTTRDRPLGQPFQSSTAAFAVPVSVWQEELVIPTYLPAAPDKNPMFLEKRVYQGSNGKVYPLPFTDRISEIKTDRKWKAVWIENEFLRVLILPEIGGRIHAIQDKTNGYDLIYNQRVIKPALVGLAGPWISGGIEFNWPQHHRPATFLPVDWEIQAHADGSKTVWLSDHDPMCRMKGMHGVCLHPGKAVVELKVRALQPNAVRADFSVVGQRRHARARELSKFFSVGCLLRRRPRAPLSERVSAGQRILLWRELRRTRAKGIPQNEIPRQFIPPHCLNKSASSDRQSAIPSYATNDLSFYANIPTPCSYMCLGSKEDFFGGYDYKAEAGIVHIANHHISSGKKQWTWGNHEFGYAWDRNLTDPDEQGICWPYIEIMSGVFTDNQPDFSFLQPGETKAWSQFWYPIQKIGPAQHANLCAAVSLKVENGKIRLGVSTTEKIFGAKIELAAKGKIIFLATPNLAPGQPFVKQLALPEKIRQTDLAICVTRNNEASDTALACPEEIISYQLRAREDCQVPPAATEPPVPENIASADELFVTGLHLEQYRHATRCPTLYWREVLRRDPLDSRCNNAMGLWHMRRGEFAKAEPFFRRAVERLTRRNPNPYDGEAFYNLGLCLSRQQDSNSQSEICDRQFDEAYAAFYKATWNRAWAAAGYHALAEMDCIRQNWGTAIEHLNCSLRLDADNLRVRNLKVVVLRRLDRRDEAEKLLQETLALDPLDWWARHLTGEIPANGHQKTPEAQVQLDIAHDFARAGFYAEAVECLKTDKLLPRDLPDQNLGVTPLAFYTLGWLCEKSGNDKSALGYYQRAAAESPNYCFPARLEEIAILESAMRANPKDARAPYYLGNLLYDCRRHEEAIRLWERSARLEPGFSIVWRNLGIGYFNISQKPFKARAAYEKAFRCNPSDARLLYERDQLWKRLGEQPKRRLRELHKFPELVRQRDDLSVELCALYNQTGQPPRALEILTTRKFQPWEGGEGAALGQHVRTHLALGRTALAQKDFSLARQHFENALASPQNLGEAKHILANQSDIHYWVGVALDALDDKKSAREHWRAGAKFKGDFQEMSVRAFSEMTFYSALSWKKLGRKTKAKKLLRDLLVYAQRLRKSQAKIDYFATSLPAMLLFENNLQFRQETTALFLQAQARLGLGQKSKAKNLLRQVLRRDPSHALAADLKREVS